MTLWEVDIHPAEGQPDTDAQRLAHEAQDLGIAGHVRCRTCHGYLLQGPLSEADAVAAAEFLLVDPVTESYLVAPAGADRPGPRPELPLVVQVLWKPGVMDPVAESTLRALQDASFSVTAVATLRKYWFSHDVKEQLPVIGAKLLANESVQRIVFGQLPLRQLDAGTAYSFSLRQVPLRDLDDDQLGALSRQGHLYLSLVEMRTIRGYYRDLGREPTDIELETIAQTWSEHCSHKTLAGPIAFRDSTGTRHFENLLRETIFAATGTIRKRLGKDDWCVSVFQDNAGIVRFDSDFDVTFKVETHNHPSAIEPYGGANTGLGGVIRDTLGTGLGARPIANTDIFCFAHPSLTLQELPPGVIHPRRVMQGVVAGVRDFGNRMGIPTVNGAICFDDRYLGNPLVYCGSVGMLPVGMSDKDPVVDDWIVSLGGRTGRDGIHGATFSSAELTEESDSVSGGAVQIGNAITEKMLADVLLQARDRGLYHAVTDCGAGGFSSAVGEMGRDLGAEVWLERAPLKYEGLSYTEIWISEAQERMVLAVPPAHWDAFSQLATSEGVEATILGRFANHGDLVLTYDGHEVGRLPMEFLHRGRPRVVRQATCHPPAPRLDRSALEAMTARFRSPGEGPAQWSETLLRLLAHPNIASKESVVRQYDHEVQGGSVIKPFVGRDSDGPSDAAVIRPRLDSHRGLAISCGINPRYGDLDTHPMAASAIDEAVRNCVAVGANPQRIALLDNFCWGNTERPETLGSLVRAILACHDLAIALGTPFISGKDSLNNEFSFAGPDGSIQSIAIPPTLLISALGLVDDVRRCVTMDFKEPGNAIYVVGVTREELGGSHFAAVQSLRDAGPAPTVFPDVARRTFAAVHEAIEQGTVRACHDVSEGGLAVALAEMAFAGGWGADCDLSEIPSEREAHSGWSAMVLFSESNTRFVVEVRPDRRDRFEALFREIPYHCVGQVVGEPRLLIRLMDPLATDPTESRTVIDVPLDLLKAAWQGTFANSDIEPSR